MLPSITKTILRPSFGRTLPLIRQPPFQQSRRLLHRQTALFVTGAEASRIIDVLVGDAHDSGCVLIDKTVADEFRAAAAAVDAGAEMEMEIVPLGFWRAEGRGWFATDKSKFPRLELTQPLGVCVQGEKSAAVTLWAFAASDCIALDGTVDDGVARLLRDTEKRLGAVIEQLKDR